MAANSEEMQHGGGEISKSISGESGIMRRVAVMAKMAARMAASEIIMAAYRLASSKMASAWRHGGMKIWRKQSEEISENRRIMAWRQSVASKAGAVKTAIISAATAWRTPASG
jgi:hypothetical protein